MLIQERAYPRLQPQSLPNMVLEQLMESIMDGKIGMGEKLNTEELATQLGVSRMPVRDAIKQLEVMGLVETTPYAGARVIELNKQDVGEIYLERKALEPLAAYYACQNITDEEIEQVEEIHKKLQAVMNSKEASAKEIFLLNRSFHSEIYKASRLKRICETITSCWRCLAFYKLIYGQTYISDPISAQKMIDDHSRCIDLLKARDADGLRVYLDAVIGKNAKIIPDKVTEWLEDSTEHGR